MGKAEPLKNTIKFFLKFPEFTPQFRAVDGNEFYGIMVLNYIEHDIQLEDYSCHI